MPLLERTCREGWPLLTVETEANGDLWVTNGPSKIYGILAEGSFLGWCAGFVVPVQEIIILPWLLYLAQ
jgi:hypothetical protein